MSATLAPFGLQAARLVGAAPDSAGNNVYSAGVSVTTLIPRGAPVLIGADGEVSLCAANTSAMTGIGVLYGAQWVDPTFKKPFWSPNIPAGTSALVGNINAYVDDNPTRTYLIQADASVTAGQVGMYALLSGVGTADGTGQSQGVLKASTVGTTAADGFVQILGLWDAPGNAWSDPYPILEVRITKNVLA